MNTTSPSELSESKLQQKIILSLILFATLTRIAIPPFLGAHLPNFSPIDAIALFCGAYFHRRLTAFSVGLLSVWIGDLFINKILMGHWTLFYEGFYWQYGSYLLITWLGTTLARQVNPLRLMTTCFAAAVLFFIVSNFGVWCSGMLYPFNFDGLIACYIAAIPFFKNTLFSDLFFSILLFGSFQWIRIKIYTKKSLQQSIL